MPESDEPHSFARRVLVLVTGLSPQVVTETIYALAVTGQPALVPTELLVLTTGEGAERARLALLSDEPGWLRRLGEEWGLALPVFDEARIRVVPSLDGSPLADLRTAADNTCAADFITEQVRLLCQDAGCAVHASIAGGRKTMGFYLGYALSLYGRPQDRLSHVLVSEPFESSPDFFFPSARERVIQVRDRNGTRPADAAQARVTLAQIPFVRLRSDLPQPLLAGRSSFSATVAAAQQARGPLTLVIDRDNSQIRVAEEVLKLAPGPMALLCVLARRCLLGLPALSAPAKLNGTQAEGDRALAVQFLAELDAVKSGAKATTADSLERGMSGEQFSSTLSRLRGELGPEWTRALIDDGGKRPYRYSLRLPAAAVAFATVAKGRVQP